MEYLDTEAEFFRINNYEECHFNHNYKKGLNKMTEPFNTSPDADSGFHFARETITKYLRYGVYLREVYIPQDPDTIVIRDPSGKKYRANKIILGKRYLLSDVETFKMLKGKVDFRVSYDFAARWAAGKGYGDILDFLIDNGCDPNAKNGHAIRLASRNGHIKVVKQLVSRGVSISFKNYEAFRFAAFNGREEVVDFLIKCGSDVYAEDNYAIECYLSKRTL